MRNFNDIAASIRRGERLSAADALVLWREAPLWLLGELATERKVAMSGRNVFYNRNVHLEPSNVCLFNCEFCSFRRREGDPDAWTMNVDEVEARAEELRGADITEVHIVGGVHPSHNLDTYVEMVRRVKRQLPHVAVKAYTAVEIFYMIKREGVTIVEGLRRLAEAGMECIPGGGAEIFDAELRSKICPDKCTAEEWLAVHRAAHNMGLSTNCTMLYGHIETLEQRIDHLERLRKLQDEAPGFDAFIPLKYHSRNNRLSAAGECSVEDDLRTIAISRLFLDNIPHIKAYWVSYGRSTTEMALAFGADDIDGTIGDTTKIYSMAGGAERPSMSVEELENMVRAVGMNPVERDSHYNIVVRDANGAVVNTAKKVDIKPIKRVEEVNENMATEKSSYGRGGDEPKRSSGSSESRPKSVAVGRKPSQRRSVEKRSGAVATFYRRLPIISHVIIIALFCLVLLAVLFIGLKRGTRHNNTIVVPDFVGTTIMEARGVAADKDLKLVVRDSIFDVDLPGGTIVDQLPSTSDVRDVTVKPGRKIYVTINAFNRRQVAVPYVAKQTLRQALNQLERSGLTVDKLVYEPDLTSTDYVEKQIVKGVEVDPASTRKVPVGTGVTLHVTYHRDNQHTVAPRIVGMSLAKAKASLWDHGFNVGKVIYDESVEDILERRGARVYKQSAAIGSSHSRGTKVDIYLSADDKMVDSLRVIADKEAERAESERRKLQLAKQREADSLAALGVNI
ncbi:MAG: CofH family radical SAM protein [Alistipes sp.]|nr:CofH family radical SAM protein [Alistipes sp.]